MVESLLDRRGIADVRAHFRSRLFFYPFDEFLIERIGHHHRKMAVFFRSVRLFRPAFRRNGFDIENRKRVRFGPKGFGDAVEHFFQFGIQSGKIVPGNVEVLDSELPRYGHEDRLFVDESAFDQHLAERFPAGMLLGGKRLIELFARDEAFVDEDFADFQPPSNVFHRLGEDLFRNPTPAHENVAKLASGSFLLFESLFQLVRSDVSLFGKYFADGPIAEGRDKSGSRGPRFRLRSEFAAPYAFRRAFRRIRGVGVSVVIHAVGHADNYAESAENIKRVHGGACESPLLALAQNGNRTIIAGINRSEHENRAHRRHGGVEPRHLNLLKTAVALAGGPGQFQKTHQWKAGRHVTQDLRIPPGEIPPAAEPQERRRFPHGVFRRRVRIGHVSRRRGIEARSGRGGDGVRHRMIRTLPDVRRYGHGRRNLALPRTRRLPMRHVFSVFRRPLPRSGTDPFRNLHLRTL